MFLKFYNMKMITIGILFTQLFEIQSTSASSIISCSQKKMYLQLRTKTIIVPTLTQKYGLTLL